MNSLGLQHADDWVFPEQIAALEGTTAEWARKKYVSKARPHRNPDDFMRAVPANGGLKYQFRVPLLDEGTQQKYLASESSSG